MIKRMGLMIVSHPTSFLQMKRMKMTMGNWRETSPPEGQNQVKAVKVAVEDHIKNRMV